MPLFPEGCQRYGALLAGKGPLLLKGSLDEKFAIHPLIAERIVRVQEMRQAAERRSLCLKKEERPTGSLVPPGIGEEKGADRA